MVFSYSTALCMNVELYIMLGVLMAGMAGYLTIEILERIKHKKTKETQSK